MFEFLRQQYDIACESALKVSPRTYKILANEKPYLLKEVESDAMYRTYTRLLLSKADAFLLPLKGKDQNYIHMDDGKYYILEEYLEDEALLGYDLKLSFYIRTIADLHRRTYYSLSVADHYLESTLNYLDDQIKKVSDSIQARMEVVEHADYHSPNDWYFLMHFQTLQNALELASKHVMNFESSVKDAKGLKICFTYQNFDFAHILLRQEKIVSLEKMGFNMAPYDLYQMVTAVSVRSLQLQPYLEEYLKINPLEAYEKEYLMALLYTFDYHRYESAKEDLEHLMQLTDYIERVNALDSDVIFSSRQEE